MPLEQDRKDAMPSDGRDAHLEGFKLELLDRSSAAVVEPPRASNKCCRVYTDNLTFRINKMPVPRLDVSQLQASPEARKRFLRDLIQSFQDYGFVRLTNHSIPAARVKQMFELVRLTVAWDADTFQVFYPCSDDPSRLGGRSVQSRHGD